MHRVGAIIGILTSLAAFMATGPAQADCVSSCQASVYCDSEMHASGECASKLNDCYISECNRTTYGAIAYGAKSGAFGWANDFNDAPSAEKEALSDCRANGDDCQVVVDFWNTCAAIAADQAVVAYGLGDTQGKAQDQAIAACTKDGGTQCVVQAWSCTGP